MTNLASRRPTPPDHSERQWWGLAFVAPAVTLFAVFSLVPVIQAIYLSFFKFDLFTPKEYVGLKNYEYLLTNAGFHQSLLASLTYAVGTCVAIWVFSFLLALVFNQDFRFRSLFLAIYFMPTVMPLVIASMVWKTMFNPQGPVNSLLGSQVNWLTDTRYAMLALIIMSVWKGVGYYLILLLAGLRNIPLEYYEAAELDGATPWQKLRHITFPLLKPTMAFVIVVSIVIAVKVFVPMFVMTGGGPDNSTNVLTMNIYETAFRFSKMGRASAESVFMFVILMFFSFAQLRLFQSETAGKR